MKVLLINGSPKANGNTAAALAEMEKVFLQEGIEVAEIVPEVEEAEEEVMTPPPNTMIPIAAPKAAP